VKQPVERVVAVVPAAGSATRLGDLLTGSKEIVDIGGEPLLVRLLGRLMGAGVDEAVVVLREGKWDIPETLLDHPNLGVDVSYVIVREPRGELHSVAAALRSTGGSLVALGYPDVLFEPPDAYGRLLERQAETGADLVLGLFPTEDVERVDMVALDDRSRPVEIVIKQPDRGLRYSWSLAVWSPVFSDYILDNLRVIAQSTTGESSVGDAVQGAIDDGMAVEAVIFEEGTYLDVGTPERLDEARRDAAD
jgi:glucose-1-phosphate thymidylyltransferase